MSDSTSAGRQFGIVHALAEEKRRMHQEIDRLTTELTEARRRQTETNVDWLINQFKLQDVEEERDRYREALERIATSHVERVDFTPGVMREIAREALGGTDERD